LPNPWLRWPILIIVLLTCLLAVTGLYAVTQRHATKAARLETIVIKQQLNKSEVKNVALTSKILGLNRTINANEAEISDLNVRVAKLKKQVNNAYGMATGSINLGIAYESCINTIIDEWNATNYVYQLQGFYNQVGATLNSIDCNGGSGGGE
jgi:cell division protein FtsB